MGIFIVVAIQFFGPRPTNPPVRVEISAPDSVRTLLHRACYNCHSNETQWPWYSRVAPVSWFVVGHVNEGRGDLNFTEWPVLDIEEQNEAYGDIRRQIEKHKMPLRSYTWMHPEARLTDEERATIIAWARSAGGPESR